MAPAPGAPPVFARPQRPPPPKHGGHGPHQLRPLHFHSPTSTRPLPLAHFHSPTSHRPLPSIPVHSSSFQFIRRPTDGGVKAKPLPSTNARSSSTARAAAGGIANEVIAASVKVGHLSASIKAAPVAPGRAHPDGASLVVHRHRGLAALAAEEAGAGDLQRHQRARRAARPAAGEDGGGHGGRRPAGSGMPPQQRFKGSTGPHKA